MVIPRDLYYILNWQSFTNAPLCRECSNDQESITADQFEVRYSFLSPNDIEVLEGKHGSVTVTATVGKVGKNEDGDHCAYIDVMDVQEIDRLDSVGYVDQDDDIRVDYRDLYDPALVTPCIMSEVQVDPWPDVMAGDRVVIEIEKTIDDNGDRWFTVARFKKHEESFEKVLNRFVEEGRFEIAVSYLVSRSDCATTSIYFVHPGTDTPENWSIKFKPYAFYNGDGKPITGPEVGSFVFNKSKKPPTNLKEMEVPVGRIGLQFGWSYHTITQCDFESIVGQVQKPARLTWRTYNVPNAYNSVSPIRAQKVEFLHKYATRIEVVDPGRKSMEEAAAAIARVLDLDLHRNKEPNSWSVPFGRKKDIRPDDPCSPGPSIPKTYIHIAKDSDYSAPHINYSIRRSNEEDDFFVVKFRALAAHKGDRQPLSDDEFMELQEEGVSTELMEVPLGCMQRIGGFKKDHLIGGDGFEKPIEHTWRTGGEPCPQKKYDFLRAHMRMIYILDPGEKSEKEAADALKCVFSPITLRHDTDSRGRDYLWRPARTYSSKSPSRSRSRSRPQSSSGVNRSDPRVPSQTVAELYGDEEQAHTHWWNTH